MMSEELINKVINKIRVIAPKIDIDDEQIKEYIELYSDFVSEKYFGKFYEKALAFFILSVHKSRKLHTSIHTLCIVHFHQLPYTFFTCRTILLTTFTLPRTAFF